ncbi:Ran GTPase-activating protein 1 [Sphaceloma murrayae]|uniref:Ran GTPase-activating protein 1 n=1 Tax=Sphaceloma murrayae TaxID=2082308 RepID=A0A2K1QNE8_9PEZI|nr:Ran GTPase-activating protein 1 [Sphaceloma murrayae]
MLASRPPQGPNAATTSTLHDLDRLLSRLTTNVLSEKADPELRTSVYLRRRTGATVEHARTLLIRLEQDIASIKVQSQRQALSTDLQTKRELIKQLNRYLIELDQLDTQSDDEEEEQEEEEKKKKKKEGRGDTQPPSQSPVSQSRLQSAPQNDNTTLRARKNPSAQPDTATTSALFSNRPSAPTSSSLKTREEVLTSQAQEQEAIKASLVSLASALKQSNISFSQSLEEEKSVLDRAASGLDKNALGMESAGRRMGTLRKMTEGQGWWGRIKLYAIIAALWVACFLLVFVGPKLRF